MSGIIDEIRAVTGGRAGNLSLIREKWGVHVYRCVYEGQSAVRGLKGFVKCGVSALRREKFPEWAEPMRKDAVSGALLSLGRELFEHAEG